MTVLTVARAIWKGLKCVTKASLHFSICFLSLTRDGREKKVYVSMLYVIE